MKRGTLGRRLYRVLLEGFILAWLAAAVVLGFSFSDVRKGLVEDRAVLARAVARSVDAVLADELQHLDRLAGEDPLAAASPAALLRDFRFHSEFRARVSVVDAAGRVVVSDPPGAAAVPTSILTDRISVTGLTQRSDSGESPVLALVRPLERDGRSHHLVAEMDAAGSWLSEHLHSLAPPGGMHVILVDEAGRVLASSAPDDLLRTVGPVEDYREIIRADTERVLDSAPCDLCGERAVSVAAPLHFAPWAAVVRQHEQEVFRAVAGARRALVTLTAVLTVAALLVSWSLSRSIVAPMTKLSGQAQRLRSGDLSHAIHVAGDHEIETLADTLDAARRKISETLSDLKALNEDLERQVQERTAATKELLQRLLGATEEERRRIARELHDKTAQLLTAMGLALDGLEGPEVDRARRILAETHREVRDVIRDLRPSLLDELGLATAIRSYAREHLERHGLDVSFEIENDVTVSPEVDITVFRILQEIITNILRHASAEHVSVELFVSDGTLTLSVEDDGVGFDPGAKSAGVGLTGLRERAGLVGGTIRFDSEPGEGTHILLEVPA